MRNNLALWKAVVIAGVTVLLAAGCGDNASGHASADATGSPHADTRVCQEGAALRVSLDNIVSFRPGKDPIASLKTDLGRAKTKLGTLRASPGNPWSPEFSALEPALQNLENASANPVLHDRPARMEQALNEVRPKVRSFSTAAKAHCPQM